VKLYPIGLLGRAPARYNPRIRPAVFLSRRIPDRVVAELDASFELERYDGDVPAPRERVLAAAAGKDGLCAMLTDRVDAELLDAAGPQLRIVANYAVGYDNVDVPACTERGVLVSNTPDVLTFATAELTLTILLGLVRRVGEGDRLIRRDAGWTWSPTFMLGASLEGKTIGVVGLGRIGREVARLAEAFGMRVVYASPSGPKPGVPWPHVPFDELLRTADVVSLHCPLSAATRHLVGAEELDAMRPEAVLVNTTRGPVVDEAALVEALRAGTIAGAALDVYEREPEVHEGLLGLENVVLAPHLGSATIETREAMGMLCVSALRAVLLEGRVPENAVNPEAAAARELR
jgi:glyoxylate reductase